MKKVAIAVLASWVWANVLVASGDGVGNVSPSNAPSFVGAQATAILTQLNRLQKLDEKLRKDQARWNVVVTQKQGQARYHRLVAMQLERRNEMLRLPEDSFRKEIVEATNKYAATSMEVEQLKVAAAKEMAKHEESVSQAHAEYLALRKAMFLSDYAVYRGIVDDARKSTEAKVSAWYGICRAWNVDCSTNGQYGILRWNARNGSAEVWPDGIPMDVYTGTTNGPGDKLRLDLGRGLVFEFCWVPAGQNFVGSPFEEQYRETDEYRRRVTVQNGFWLGKYEVTQGQWREVMGDNPSQFKEIGPSAPVENVSWLRCREFADKLTMRLAAIRASGGKKYPCSRFRLPSEVEWEYACRAGTATPYVTGCTDAALDAVGWFRNNSGNAPHPVGLKAPNAWGLHDMHGNVWEWCSDPYLDLLAASFTYEPRPADVKLGRVNRGGSWYDPVMYCRAANRYVYADENANSGLGLRLLAE